jgi:hypothetical protein
MNGVRFPVEAKDFLCILCVQTGSETQPASRPIGTGGPSPRGKARQVREADYSLPSSVELNNE